MRGNIGGNLKASYMCPETSICVQRLKNVCMCHCCGGGVFQAAVMAKVQKAKQNKAAKKKDTGGNRKTLHSDLNTDFNTKSTLTSTRSPQH